MHAGNGHLRATAALLGVILAATVSGFAATLTVQVEPAEVSLGDPVTLSISVENGAMGKVDLPAVDGIQVTPQASSTTSAFSAGTYTVTITEKYQLIASHAGDFTIPAFDVPLQNGMTLRSNELKFHVLESGQTPSVNPDDANAPSPSVPQTPAGPVILPPVNPATSANSNQAASAAVSVPRDKDGGPAKVFIVITVQTTDAYVGQAVPLRIDFYIREAVAADQDSLPTIRGTDFLVSGVSERPNESLTTIEGEPYGCQTWLTAVSAPKSGDFSLVSERDTYWVKSVTPSGNDPFGFTRHTNLAHEVIASNQLTMHIHPLPLEGRPEHFTGVIGQFQVKGDAQPSTITMGEPVILTFSVAGVGNFDYVRCPALADDKNWRPYTPTSTTTFDPSDESRTHAVKTFEQSVIPRKNGNVPLPAVAFSYFDPYAKRYVTVPINLPTIAVTGAMPLPAPAPADGIEASAPPVVADTFLPNRADLGSLQTSMVPAYRYSWFWMVQGALAALPLLGLLILFMRRNARRGVENAESISWKRSLGQEESAMEEALRKNDALAFFIAARHSVQLQLGAQWSIAPEALTLREIHRRDPVLADKLSPLFMQADEVIYSGRAPAKLDLAHWATAVREFLQLQTA